MVIKDDKEATEEEFYLEDVERLVYEDQGQTRDLPHWVKVYIKSSGVDRTRWRKKDGSWLSVTSPFLVLPLKDKSPADEVMKLMQSLAGLSSGD